MSVRIAKPAIALGALGVLLVAMDLPGSLPGSWVPYYRLVTAAVVLPVGSVLALRARRVRPRLGARSLRTLRVRTVGNLGAYLHGGGGGLFLRIGAFGTGAYRIGPG